MSERPEPDELVFTAKQALEMTKRVHLANIFSFIEKAINEGKCECEILPAQQFVSTENKKILEDAGYKVISKESMLGTEILISWENA